MPRLKYLMAALLRICLWLVPFVSLDDLTSLLPHAQTTVGCVCFLSDVFSLVPTLRGIKSKVLENVRQSEPRCA